MRPCLCGIYGDRRRLERLLRFQSSNIQELRRGGGRASSSSRREAEWGVAAPPPELRTTGGAALPFRLELRRGGAALPPHAFHQVCYLEGEEDRGRWQRRRLYCKLWGEPRSLPVWDYGGGQRYPLTPTTRSATWKGRGIVGGGSAAFRTANYGGSRAPFPPGTTEGGRQRYIERVFPPKEAQDRRRGPARYLSRGDFRSGEVPVP